jgi:hypothetical protein
MTDAKNNMLRQPRTIVDHRGRSRIRRSCRRRWRRIESNGSEDLEHRSRGVSSRHSLPIGGIITRAAAADRVSKASTVGAVDGAVVGGERCQAHTGRSAALVRSAAPGERSDVGGLRQQMAKSAALPVEFAKKKSPMSASSRSAAQAAQAGPAQVLRSRRAAGHARRNYRKR